MSKTKNNRRRAEVDYTLGMCFLCNGIQDFDHDGRKQTLLKCFDCHRNGEIDPIKKEKDELTRYVVHASCSDIDKAVADIAQTYDWQCNDCKSCLVCLSKNDEDKIVICSHCDRGYHTFCCDPLLKYIPEDDWYCNQCSSMPSPPNSLPSPVQYNQPLTPLSDNNKNNTSSKHKAYRLRQSPTHSAKFIESKAPMPIEIKRKPMKRKSDPLPQGDENKRQSHEPLKLRLTIAEPAKKKRSKPKVSVAALEEEEEFFKTFGNKLTKAEANTIRGTPTESDIIQFDKAKTEVEHHLAQINTDQKWEVPKICKIAFNNYLIDTWYVAPYPEEYSQSSTLYICEFCMKYMRSSYIFGRHQLKCKAKFPPGDEIYRDGKISIFEVDGRKNKIYCQNLCLMAKMFLDHKTLYYDVEPFLFYIMTEVDHTGCHFVGYFSKEKRSSMNYNVSCILTMPIFQRKGYGQFLIDFSYLLSKKESKTGSPERPLSDLGLLSYRSYWKNTVFRELENLDHEVSIEDLSDKTSLTPDDIISTLQNNDMLRSDKGTGKLSIIINAQVIRAHLDKLDKKNYIRVNPEKLTWTPFVLSRDRLAALLGQKKVTIKDNDESADVEVV